MIEIKNLSKEFSGFVAVNDLSLSIQPGEVLGFLGPNGAGKSTTMKMLAGFIKPSKGAVTVMGYNVARRPRAAKRQIGYLPEGAPLYGDMTPPAFLEFIARVREVPAASRDHAVATAMQQLQLEEMASKRIEELSKGFKRRVGIAQAIIHDPAVLILDEPTDGLDPNQKHQVRQLIRNLAKDKIVILSTHILEEVSAVCNRAVIISQGKLVADQTPAQLQARSRYHQAVTLELDSTRDLNLVEKAFESIKGVAGVERNTEHATRLSVLAKTGQVIHEDVIAVVRQNDWKVASLYVETGQLEDVFRDLTEKRVGHE